MRDSFTYNNTNSLSAYNCVIQRRPNYTTPQKVVETFNVRGRSGDLAIDTGAYSNITLEYEVFVPHENRSEFANWLKMQIGYQRLEDTYEPDVFRKAMYVKGLDIENIMAQFGTATLEFDAKPQRYLKDGENAVVFTTSGGTLDNDWEVALPLITITGSGDITFAINNNIVNISDLQELIILDSETQNCYRGNINLNGSISISGTEPTAVDFSTLQLNTTDGFLYVLHTDDPDDVTYTVGDDGVLYASINANGNVGLGTTGKFPVLERGRNTISWTGNVTSVSIIPRWWKL